MKPEHLLYLREIGMSRAAVSRAEYLHEIIQRAAPFEIEDVFVNDSVSDEGIRSQQSLWFFGADRVTEFKNMMTNVAFDFVSLAQNQMWIDVSAHEYDFDEVTDNSRLSVTTVIRDRLGFQFKAVRNNCPYLTTILRTRISVV